MSILHKQGLIKKCRNIGKSSIEKITVAGEFSLVGSWFGKLTMTSGVTLSLPKGDEESALWLVHGSTRSP
jgi:hypothetical protein